MRVNLCELTVFEAQVRFRSFRGDTARPVTSEQGARNDLLYLAIATAPISYTSRSGSVTRLFPVRASVAHPFYRRPSNAILPEAREPA